MKNRKFAMPEPAILDEILAALPDPALIVGADERVVSANAAGLMLFGSGIVGRHHAFVLRHPETLTAIAEARAGRRSEARHVIRDAAHEVIHRVTTGPVAGGVLCTFQDLTDRERMDAMRRDFVANVSHELRTPLTSLLGFIETLRGPARDDGAARERFLGIMQTEAERMVRLVRDLLHLSRVEAQERQRPAERHDIAQLVRSAVHSLRPQAEAAGVRFDLIDLDAPMLIPADPDQITQVAMNLIENAIKYGGPGKVVTVRLGEESGPRGRKVRFSVQDQGEGIEEHHLPRLAERFYRVDGHRSREKGGTGLGLAIVKHIAHRHRGRLVIESAIGLGSCFSLLLPRD
jgi:two-component system phosphate regulon sensor histidine kinase PhoR